MGSIKGTCCEKILFSLRWITTFGGIRGWVGLGLGYLRRIVPVYIGTTISGNEVSWIKICLLPEGSCIDLLIECTSVHKSFTSYIAFTNTNIYALFCLPWILFICRSSPPEVFLRKGVLKICSKFTGEYPCRSTISITLLCNLIEIALRYGCSPENLPHIFRTPFPRNTSGWLLLYYENFIKI